MITDEEIYIKNRDYECISEQARKAVKDTTHPGRERKQAQHRYQKIMLNFSRDIRKEVQCYAAACSVRPV